MKYLFSKAEFCTLYSVLTGSVVLPVELSSYFEVLPHDKGNIYHQLANKGMIKSMEPLVIDATVAFLIIQLSECDRFIHDKGAQYTIAYCPLLVIIISGDAHRYQGIKIIPVRDTKELEELKYELENGGSIL